VAFQVLLAGGPAGKSHADKDRTRPPSHAGDIGPQPLRPSKQGGEGAEA
jgi:hypothetical protein